MNNTLKAVAVAVTLIGTGVAATNTEAQPVASRFFNGHQWCYYNGGWHGRGWYGCGYGAWRHGYGWGGPRGWNGWDVGVAVGPVGVQVGAPYYHAWGGQRYCWFGNGWHGAGWYGCGYGAWRHGYGWGGPRGWNRW